MQFKYNENKFNQNKINELFEDIYNMLSFFQKEFIDGDIEEYFSLSKAEQIIFLKQFDNEEYTIEEKKYIYDVLNNKEEFENLLLLRKEALINLKTSFLLIKDIFINKNNKTPKGKKLSNQELNSLKNMIMETYNYYSYIIKRNVV